MSGSLYIVGNFAVKDGTLEAAGRGSRHLVYHSAFNGTQQTAIGALIRTYEPSGTTLTDGTIVFVAGKLHTPRGQRAIISCYKFCPYPGDPDDPGYEASIAPLNEPIVFAVGKVASPVIPCAHAHLNHKQFGLETSQFFTDGVITTNTK
jgi:hypothetical protein